jgi:hypothetical protein
MSSLNTIQIRPEISGPKTDKDVNIQITSSYQHAPFSYRYLFQKETLPSALWHGRVWAFQIKKKYLFSQKIILKYKVLFTSLHVAPPGEHLF